MQNCTIAADSVLSSGWKLGNYPAIRLDETIPWESSNDVGRSWSFHIHCWDMLNAPLMAYSLTGNLRYFSPALHIALDWADKYPGFDTVSGFAWYDMAVGVRALRLAYILDVASRLDDVEDKKIQDLLGSLMLHRQYLADDKNIVFHNNHGFFQAAGQLAMAKRFEDIPVFKNDTDQATKRLKGMIFSQFSDEGVHLEHSPDYHRQVYTALMGVLNSGLFDDAEVNDFALKVEASLAWFVLPSGFLVNFGDSDRRSLVRGKTYSRQWKTPAMKFIASGGQEGVPPRSTMAVFKQSGYFIVRDPWPKSIKNFNTGSYLAQTLCFHSRTHKHADDLSFVWYDHGCEILVDAGRYGYLNKTAKGSELAKQGYWYGDPYRMHIEDSCAHNTVEVDRTSNPRVGVKPYGSALQQWGRTTGGQYFSVGQILQHKTILHRRILVFAPGKWLLVYDFLYDNMKQNHHYSQWFHFAPSLSPQIIYDQVLVRLAPEKKPLRVVSLFPGITLSGVFLGEIKPRLQGWWSPKEREIVPGPVIAFEQKKKPSTAFATLFGFCNDLIPDFKNINQYTDTGNIALQWKMDGVEHKLNIIKQENANEWEFIV